MIYYNTTMTSTQTEVSKILPYTDLKDYISGRKDKRIVLVGGCFDLLHFGHLFFLKKAKEAGDLLVIALESDEFVVATKNRQPVHTQMQRAQILSHLDLVDAVILLPLLQNNEDYFSLTRTVKPEVIAVTKGDPVLHYKKEQAKDVGASIVEVDLVKEFSSSNIMKYAAIFSD